MLDFGGGGGFLFFVFCFETQAHQSCELGGSLIGSGR